MLTLPDFQIGPGFCGGHLMLHPDQSRILRALLWVFLVIMGRVQDRGKQRNQELDRFG